MRKNYNTYFILFLSFLILLSGCSSLHPGTTSSVSSELKVLTIGTADSGGTMYPVGKAIAQAISDIDEHIKVNLSASNGSAFNVDSLENGEIDLGLVSGDIAYAAANGLDEFAENPTEDLRAIAAVYPSLSNWMVLADSGISYVHELKGLNVGIGPQSSTTELSARIALQSMDIDQQNSNFTICGIGSGASEVKKGTLDAIHGFAGVPISGFAELADSIPCTVLKYTDQELDSILKENIFYYRDVIPAGTYAGQEEEIETFGIKCLLCVSASTELELVYELTKILYEHSEELGQMHSSLSSMSNDGFMYKDIPITLHPGAKRYYEEQGFLSN